MPKRGRADGLLSRCVEGDVTVCRELWNAGLIRKGIECAIRSGHVLLTKRLLAYTGLHDAGVLLFAIRFGSEEILQLFRDEYDDDDCTDWGSVASNGDEAVDKGNIVTVGDAVASDEVTGDAVDDESAASNGDAVTGDEGTCVGGDDDEAVTGDEAVADVGGDDDSVVCVGGDRVMECLVSNDFCGLCVLCRDGVALTLEHWRVAMGRSTWLFKCMVSGGSPAVSNDRLLALACATKLKEVVAFTWNHFRPSDTTDALRTVIREDDVEMLRYLGSCGVTVSTADEFYAIEHNALNVCRELLATTTISKHWVDVAIFRGYYELTKFLLERRRRVWSAKRDARTQMIKCHRSAKWFALVKH